MTSRPDVRIYGSAPYRVAVVHGGPGAPGYMAPVARELAKAFGVVEPLQTKDSLDGQTEELREQLDATGDTPMTLIGSSWGAVLVLLTAARYPHLASKLVLIGSAVFDAESSRKTKALRLSRTSPETLAKVHSLEQQMKHATGKELNRLMEKIADLEFEPDVYDPITRDLELLDTQKDINQKVWKDFVVLRDQPELLRAEIAKVKCDTVIVHGDHDPHVIEGIHPFLTSCLPTIRLEWLEKCGHYPWIERQAKDRFFEILRREVVR